MKKRIFLYLALFLGAALRGAPCEAADYASIKPVPVQHNGRVKPFDSFARQTLKTLAGSERWEKKPAYLVVLDMLSDRDSIKNRELIRIDYAELIRYLGLAAEKHFFSYAELSAVKTKVEFLAQNARSKRQKDERPSRLEQKAETLYGQLTVLEALQSGEMPAVVPGNNGQMWLSADRSPAKPAADFKQLLSLYKTRQKNEFKEKVAAYLAEIQADFPSVETPKIRLEVLYFDIDPFQKAAIFYFLAFLALSVFSAGKLSAPAGHFALLFALLFHTFGIASRVFILSRPPVSNMFESMIFMNWALMFFALVFALIKKNWAPVSIGCLASGLIMVYSHLLPIDSSLDVLVPVLRSNYWLSIHVMTVVSSYGAFGLAMGLGHRYFILSYFKKLNKKSREESAELINRVIQLGVILIGTGTFLGGVWANESWGRFWGWDPKETWALITFLSYLFVIHLRFLKKLDNFYLALASLIGFFVVLMTWYGVNFVLGRGLHSYGQGQGGMQWVLYFLGFELFFIGFVLLNKKRLKS